MRSNHADLQKTRASTSGKVADIHTAAKIIRDCGIVIYPTETVYGIGADALSGTAVRKVFAIKKRSSPVSLAVSSYGMIEDVSVCDADTMDLIRKLLPGPITVILTKKTVVPDILTAGYDRVGIRYPDHEITIRLIDLSGTPVTSTSANLPGEPPAREVCEISADVLWMVLTVSSMPADASMESLQPLSILWTCRFFGRVRGTSGLRDTCGSCCLLKYRDGLPDYRFLYLNPA